MLNASRHQFIFVLLGTLLTLAITAGCAPVGPDFQAPRPKLPEQYSSGQLSSLPDTQISVDRWWQLFEDPLLAQLLNEASAANHNLKKAEASIREARAQRIIAASQGSLGAAASTSSARRSDNVSPGSQDLFQLGFDARWELDLFGAKKRATEAAEATLAATGEVRRNVLVSLHAEVARVYIELRGAQRRLATAATTLAIQQQTAATVRGRLQLGFDSQLDLYQAQTQEALTRAGLPGLERSARQAMHQLALLLGQPPAALVSRLSADPWQLRLPDHLPLELPSELLRRRPDIRAAEQRLAAATANIGVAVADLFPKFSLSGLLGLQSTDLSSLLSGGSRYWSIGPSLSLPLFDREKLHAAVDVSTARRDQAFAEYQQTVLEALGEVENGLVAFTQEQKTLGPLREAAVSARQALEIAQGRYQAGLAEFLHVLQTERTLLSSEDLLAQSEQRLALAVVAVYKALGGGAENAPPSRTSPESPVAASP
jgi:outer membrane protein, multidrug efflux system